MSLNDKKMQLVQAAIKLFGEKDYHTTSVQDIVSLAGVSKGAFYQHFQSKDELLVSIFSHYFEMTRNQLEEAQRQNIPTRELIMKAIQLPCQLVLENKDFLSLIVKGISLAHNDQLTRLFTEETMQSARWFRNRIIELYGPSIEPYSLDYSCMMNGMLKEYFFHAIIHQHPLNLEKLSSFLFDRLDEIVTSMLNKQTEPILPSSLLKEKLPDPADIRICRMQIAPVRAWIDGHIENRKSAESMIQSLDAIVSELEKEQPNQIIIQGMYSYLLTLAHEHKALTERFEELFASRLVMPG